MSLALSLTVSTFILTALAATYPKEVLWSNITFGPDGPWRAVKTNIGGKDISLFPGTNWETWLIEDDYCGDGTCYASEAGTHNRNHSGSGANLKLDSDYDYFQLGMNLGGGNSMRYVDDIDINGLTVTNTSLTLIKSPASKIKYPGTTAPFFAGCLSVGSKGGTNADLWPAVDGAPKVKANMPPGFLWDQGYTPSNSFGLHIGSVEPDLAGSLWFGGYDRNRVVGDPITNGGDFKDPVTILQDIGIEVLKGKSPFDFNGTKAGLLMEGNSSMPITFKVMIDGCSPYLTLPKSTCDNIASHLPVTFDKMLGLYLWNTSSEKYKEIVPSATALSFSFTSSGNSNPIKIRVPFMHLNLTLTAPLVDTPTQYFPCHVNEKGKYVLGRAFLQDAFLGGNWDLGVNRWWIAQAPGPNIPTASNVLQIATTDETIRKSDTSWEDSWKGVWKEVNTTSDDSTSSNDNEGGLSTGAKAGIGAGVGVVSCLLILGAVYFWKRRQESQSQGQNEAQINDQSNGHPLSQYYGPPKIQELQNHSVASSWHSPSPSQPTSELTGSRPVPPELTGSRPIPPELTGSGPTPSELHTPERVHEMA
ncbi:unnamed protein product [Clonostachys chloroleuca]|uniref:Peptidase A1 domain-containing protein n=1 Tax=Clonostachys chloroleuca TaxID=1926264 RepID=A0AA35LV52_9HYPO|nr:unnamed protein product [Clonostachys chloroleuca]